MNLYDQGLLDTAAGFAAALVLGLLFGFWLERAGFGSSRKLMPSRLLALESVRTSAPHHCEISAPEVQTFWPLITQVSP